MPELPEVETIKRQLEKVIRNQKIESVRILRKKSFVGARKELIGKKIKKIDRRGKLLILELAPLRGKVGTEKRCLVIHLKMTGQLVYVSGSKRIVGGHPTSDWMKKLPSKHTRVVIKLTKGTLFFNDLRVFGWMKLLDPDQVNHLLGQLGPDVTSKHFDKNYLRDVLEVSGRKVKLVLLDQNKMAGLGNIYVNDGLYYAKVNPGMRGNKLALDEEKVHELYIGIKRVIGRGIQYKGASETNYVHVDGMGGTYQEHYLVYKKNGQPCERCQTKIKKIMLGGRGTYYCPKCQRV
jgi:formamidopyrimidine-DNA glycosylase